MEEIKNTIAKNIVKLRTAKGWTQVDLAQKLHYSDKAVSKWERAESVPEIGTLTALADMFDVPLDYLVRQECSSQAVPPKAASNIRKKKNHAIIACMSVLLVWFIALFTYVLTEITTGDAKFNWLSFIYAVPVSLIVWLIFNCIWFNRRVNYLIISLLVWFTLTAIHITFITLGYNIWLIYLLGIPGQVIIVLWSKLRYKTA